MLRKSIIAATASLAAFVALPSAAQADYRGGGYYDRGYSQSYYRDNYYREAPRRYQRGDYYGQSRYRGSSRRGYDRGYYRDRRCGSGTTGAIVGGAAGALLGREIDRDGRRYSRRGNSGTTGAIIGGALGALVGREVGRSC